MHFAAGMVMAFNVGEKEQAPPNPMQVCNPVVQTEEAGKSTSSSAGSSDDDGALRWSTTSSLLLTIVATVSVMTVTIFS